MIKDWTELTQLARGGDIIVERVRLPERDISIEGEFALPPMARLSEEDQVFIMAFVGSHGSLKNMERLFGISYPTVKNRLEKLASQLKMVEFEPAKVGGGSEVLALLEENQITVEEALRRLKE